MEKKRSSILKALAGFSVGALLVSGLVLGASAPDSAPSIFESPITDASAGVSGGGGGSGGGGSGGTSYARWMEASRTRIYNGSINNLPGEMWDATCQNAQKYFVLVPNVVSDSMFWNDRWTFSLYGVRNLAGANFGNGSSVANQIASNVGWSYQQAADYMFQKNFICLDNPNRWDGNEWRYEIRSSATQADLDESGIINFSSQVTPVKINAGTLEKPNMVDDPIGEKNLNAETVVTTTAFGRVFNEFEQALKAGADRRNLVAEYQGRLRNARAEDERTNPSAVLNLNENNQKGMGEGGILNIQEYAQPARATASTTTNNNQVWRCGWDHYTVTGWQPTGCQPVSGTINPDALDYAGKGYARWDSQAQRNAYNPPNWGATFWQAASSSGTTVYPTRQNRGFWQMISAHCNEEGFRLLSQSVELVNLFEDGGSNSGLYRTKHFDSKPNILPLGDNRAAEAGRVATSMLGFYDKECPFDCRPSSTGAGASNLNGATGNTGDSNFEKTTKGKFGALSADGLNSNYVELFRDNSENSIRLDTWYPIPTSVVQYDGAAAKTTLFTRWASGTPTVGTEFNAKAVVEQKDANGKIVGEPKVTDLFLGTSKAIPEQKSFESKPSTFKGPTATQVEGQVNRLDVRSTWASAAGKPQALQVAWEYSPKVLTKIPTGVSFDRTTGKPKTSNIANIYTNVDGRCWAEFGTKSTQTGDISKKDLNTTGSKSTPAFYPVPNGSENTVRNLVLNFVRAAGQ